MWEQIRSNRLRSIILVIGMGALLVALGWFLGIAFADDGVVGLIVALIVWGFMNLIAYFQGDSILLSVAGARKIKPQDHPRLYNVVEEMKIASGLEKMPDVYIIDDPALNAFATGRDTNHASVAITSGLLQKLNRDELQGVIAHEISHIKNRDVLLMAMCSILLGTIVLLSYYGSRMMMFGGMGGRSRRSSSKDSGGSAGAIIMIVAVLLMVLAPLFAQLIYFAISRKREYLADASSALYTRYPEGLASALEKLSQSATPVKSANQATAPMYIVNPFRRQGMSVNSLTSTHPPIQERIRILRAMAGGASFAVYDQAYRKVKNSRSGVMSAATVAAAGAVGLRPAGTEGALGEPQSEKIARTREVNDLMYRMDDYRIIDCECGARLKVPPSMEGSVIKCPRCGSPHET
ncbi:MAG: M48 family metallopeptidase [Dehalococcoidales bacterium]|nr:M48 family metallopeptidase [Dehalococcoidales bacterium]